MAASDLLVGQKVVLGGKFFDVSAKAVRFFQCFDVLLSGCFLVAVSGQHKEFVSRSQCNLLQLKVYLEIHLMEKLSEDLFGADLSVFSIFSTFPWYARGIVDALLDFSAGSPSSRREKSLAVYRTKENQRASLVMMPPKL